MGIIPAGDCGTTKRIPKETIDNVLASKPPGHGVGSMLALCPGRLSPEHTARFDAWTLSECREREQEIAQALTSDALAAADRLVIIPSVSIHFVRFMIDYIARRGGV